MDLTGLIIRRSDREEILPLRREILRVGQPPGTERFTGDDESTTCHVVAELSGEIVGCVTIMRQPWNDQPAWQLRGMAVAKELQGRGVGGFLLDEIDRIARIDSFSKQLWCNARTPASRFYQNHGWKIESDEFIVPNFGPHVMMAKRLEPQVDADKRG